MVHKNIIPCPQREYHMWEGLIALQKIISESLDQLSMKN